MKINELIGKDSQIISSQATYLQLAISDQIIRIDFIEKCEFFITKMATGLFNYFETHPLLLNYNERIDETFVNSKSTDPDRVTFEIENVINDFTKGWRNWKSFFTDNAINFTVDHSIQNLKNGNGILLKAPESITKAVASVCKNHHISIKTIEGNFAQSHYKLITIGNNFVIAKEFRLTLMP